MLGGVNIDMLLKHADDHWRVAQYIRKHHHALPSSFGGTCVYTWSFSPVQKLLDFGMNHRMTPAKPYSQMLQLLPIGGIGKHEWPPVGSKA